MRDFDTEEKAAMLLDLGAVTGVRFRKNGRVLGPPVAFQSQALTRDLLKIGFFAMNVHSMASMRPVSDPGTDLPRLPAALLGVAFHYALEAAPRAIVEDPAESAGRLPGDIVDIPGLERQVLQIERSFGAIDIDMEVVAATAILAARAALPRDPAGDPGGMRE
jgi:hypothetical protein